MTNEWDDPPADEDEDEEIGPGHPGDPDYDLSEAHGYTWEPERNNWPLPPVLMALVTVLVVIALVLPGLLIFLRYG